MWRKWAEHVGLGDWCTRGPGYDKEEQHRPWVVGGCIGPFVRWAVDIDGFGCGFNVCGSILVESRK